MFTGIVFASEYVRVSNLLRLPGVTADVQGKTVETRVVRELNVRLPIGHSVRICVADDVVGDDELAGSGSFDIIDGVVRTSSDRHSDHCRQKRPEAKSRGTR